MLKRKIFIGWQFLKYQLFARHRNGHGIHSPFVFKFAREAIFNKEQPPEVISSLLNLMSELRRSKQTIVFKDVGSKSLVFRGNTRKIADLIKYSSLPEKYGLLLFRMVQFLKPTTIIELGTSIGISTLFLASGSKASKVITIEANQNVMNVAKVNAAKLNLSNLSFFNGYFDDVLQKVLPKSTNIQLVFIDGNHTYESTLKYFKLFSENMREGVIIFDDIYLSWEMAKAWKEIEGNSIVSIDLFRFGLVIIRPSITPAKYRIRF